MAVLHISEAELARDVPAVLERLQSGLEVIVERNAQPIAVLRAPESQRRKLSEIAAALAEDSTAVIDPDFAEDVQGAVDSHREPLDSSVWDLKRAWESFWTSLEGSASRETRPASHRLHIIAGVDCGAGWHPASRLLTGSADLLPHSDRYEPSCGLTSRPQPSRLLLAICDADHWQDAPNLALN